MAEQERTAGRPGDQHRRPAEPASPNAASANVSSPSIGAGRAAIDRVSSMSGVRLGVRS